MEVTKFRATKKSFLATIEAVLRDTRVKWIKTWHPKMDNGKDTTAYSYSLEPPDFKLFTGHQLFADPTDTEWTSLYDSDQLDILIEWMVKQDGDGNRLNQIVNIPIIGVATDKKGEHAGKTFVFLRIK